MSLPNVFFGSPDVTPMDWRKDVRTDAPDDDAELFKTPNDVVSLLGFDPLEAEES